MVVGKKSKNIPYEMLKKTRVVHLWLIPGKIHSGVNQGLILANEHWHWGQNPCLIVNTRNAAVTCTLGTPSTYLSSAVICRGDRDDTWVWFRSAFGLCSTSSRMFRPKAAPPFSHYHSFSVTFLVLQCWGNTYPPPHLYVWAGPCGTVLGSS